MHPVQRAKKRRSIRRREYRKLEKAFATARESRRTMALLNEYYRFTIRDLNVRGRYITVRRLV